jgi:hypothetical protein
VSGIASRYDDTYPSELEGYISGLTKNIIDRLKVCTEENFKKDIDRINEAIAEFWPCSMCYIFGFACAPLTLGTSLCCPHYCISRAESNLVSQLEDISLTARYYDKQIVWSVQKKCFASWIEITFPLSPSSL